MAGISHDSLLRLRLVLALAAALLIVFLLESVPGLRDAFRPMKESTAMLAFFGIKATGLAIAIDDIVLTHPDGFRVSISYGCTPLVPAVFLVSVLTIGISLGWRQRLTAISSGIALLTLLNLFRVTAVYYVGVHSPGAYNLAHLWLGQGFIVLGTAIVACYWISTSVTTRPRVLTL